MAKFVCQVCGYVYEGDSAPEFCPVCKAPASKFTKQEETLTWAAEHVVGVAKGVSEDILADLRANFQGECSGGWYVSGYGSCCSQRRLSGNRLILGEGSLTKRLSMQLSLQRCSVRTLSLT